MTKKAKNYLGLAVGILIIFGLIRTVQEFNHSMEEAKTESSAEVKTDSSAEALKTIPGEADKPQTEKFQEFFVDQKKSGRVPADFLYMKQNERIIELHFKKGEGLSPEKQMALRRQLFMAAQSFKERNPDLSDKAINVVIEE